MSVKLSRNYEYFTAQNPLVGIIMGSTSDLPVMELSADILEKLQIPFEITVASAHRCPKRVAEYAATAQKRGLTSIIAGAGAAAALPGTVAAHSALPVIGVPLNATPLLGIDALLAICQMPSSIPVATMAIGEAGAKNAGFFAAKILALKSPEHARILELFYQAQTQKAQDTMVEAL